MRSAASASASLMSAMRPSSANCRADRFTATRMPDEPLRAPLPACAHAVRSTQRPIGTMSPVSSASGMNWSGATMPRSGWFQRSSASTPTMRPVPMSTRRLVVQHELAAAERLAQRRFEREPLERMAVLLRRIELEVVLAPLLGEVHRDVGVLEQRLRIVAVDGIGRRCRCCPSRGTRAPTARRAGRSRPGCSARSR